MRERKVNKIKGREKIKEISNVRQRFITQEIKEKDKGLNYYYLFVFVRVIYLYSIRDYLLIRSSSGLGIFFYILTLAMNVS